MDRRSVTGQHYRAVLDDRPSAAYGTYWTRSPPAVGVLSGARSRTPGKQLRRRRSHPWTADHDELKPAASPAMSPGGENRLSVWSEPSGPREMEPRMKATVVRYQVKPERADENQQLIEAVFADLEAREAEGFT